MPVVLTRRPIPEPRRRPQHNWGWVPGALLIAGALLYSIYGQHYRSRSHGSSYDVRASLNSGVPQSATLPPEGYTIKGNISVTTGAKLYHVPGMRDYEITVIDPSRGERWFRTEAEAQGAGWIRADSRGRTRNR